MVAPVCFNAPDLVTILENNAGLEFLTKTRKVHARRLLSASAHGYPIPSPALEYIKQHHKEYLTDEAQAQLKAADPYVPGSAPTHYYYSYCKGQEYTRMMRMVAPPGHPQPSD